LLVRRYRESDRESIRQLTVEGFGNVSIDANIQHQFGTLAGHDWQWRKARHVEQDLDAPGAAVLVAQDDQGQIVGYITTRIDRESGIGMIPNLAVCAAQRGTGIGRLLIESALELFREEKLELARIETLEQNAIGQHLYPTCGFVEVARQIHYALLLDPAKDS
jgi:ribosomal protein S18 acetylase RimI-like enzyme